MKQKIDEHYPIVVKITRDDDGYKVESPKWHYIENGDAQRTLCSGEVFGYGEGRAEFKTKRGKISCSDCIAILKKHKSVKL